MDFIFTDLFHSFSQLPYNISTMRNIFEGIYDIYEEETGRDVLNETCLPTFPRLVRCWIMALLMDGNSERRTRVRITPLSLIFCRLIPRSSAVTNWICTSCARNMS